MFSKKKKTELSQQVISTLISHGCVIDGNVKMTEYIRVDGVINGDVNVEGGLILGEKGIINGDIITKEIVVYGAVYGTVRAQSLEIRSSGKISGDIKAEVLQVEAGGVHDGRLSMSTPSSSSSPKLLQPEVITA